MHCSGIDSISRTEPQTPHGKRAASTMPAQWLDCIPLHLHALGIASSWPCLPLALQGGHIEPLERTHVSLERMTAGGSTS